MTGNLPSGRRARIVLAGEFVVATVPLLFVPSLGIVQGGFFPDAWVWSGALLAWVAALALVLRSEHRVPLRWTGVWLAALGALLVWTAASAAWSTNATQSVLEARRTVVYVAAAFALVFTAGRHATRPLVAGLHLALCVLLGYALLDYLLGARHLDVFEGYLLSQPLGYANAIGILATIGILLASAPALHGARVVRAAAAGSIPLFAFALALSESRASWVALVVGGCVIVFLERRRTAVLALALTVAPCSAVLAWLTSADGLNASSALHDHRRSLFLVALLGALLTAAAAAALPTWAFREGRSQRVRGGALAALGAGAAAAAILVAVTGHTVPGLGPRAAYWHVAWHVEYLAHPYLGSGAGTFAGFWAMFGPVASSGGALDAHSLYLEMLAELGPIGLALTLVALCVPLAPLLERGPCPRYIPQAAGAYVAFLLHAGVDWDWEMPAVTVTGLCCGAALLAGGRTSSQPLPAAVRFAALAAVLALGAGAIAGARSGGVPGTTPADRTFETARAPQLGEALAIRWSSDAAQNFLVTVAP